MLRKKKFESGAHKRKISRQKENSEKELFKKIPKLTGFFKPANEGESSSLSGAPIDEQWSGEDKQTGGQC
jgi:hypothetical protein